MGSIVHCLLRNCFEDEDNNDEDSDHHRPDGFLETPAPEHMLLNRDSVYVPPNTGLSTDDHTSSTNEQNQPLTHDPLDNPRSTTQQQHHHSNLSNFFRIISQSIRDHHQYRREEQHHQQQQHENNNSYSNATSNHAPASPLRPAHDFDKNQLDNIPTIALDEVVLPGSELQKQMSLYLKNQLKCRNTNKVTKHLNDESEEDEEEEDEENLEECVICMEGFDSANPRMPTICGCGENKTFFHLPCLYQWIGDGENGTSNRTCPSCRQPLSWEEF